MISFLAKLILRKYRPTVIAITGSVGKTTTKAALAAVVAHRSQDRRARVSAVSDNDYTGMLRTIVGGGIARGIALLFFRDPQYPITLVLEYGVTQEGDMKIFLDCAKPDIAVITSFAPVELESFRSLERLTREKSAIAQHTKRDGWVILNADDERVYALKARVKTRLLTFGFHESADVRAVEVNVHQTVENGVLAIKGTSFKLMYKGSAVPVHLSGVLGGPHIAGALASAAVGIIMGMNLVSISEALATYVPPPGRMRLLQGIKKTVLIDDTYTATPVSCLLGLEGLDVLAVRPGSEKFAVLGDMVALGAMTQAAHTQVGERVAVMGADYLITVGKLSRDIGNAARAKGMKEERVYHCTTAEEAGRFLQERLEDGDCVYVSGASGLRMERIVKEVMAEPLKANALLVQR